jgi:DivIVA domain-containing protein
MRSADTRDSADTTLGLPVSFALTLRGYDREQVDEYVDQLNAELHLLTADRDAAVTEAELLARHCEQLRTENSVLRARIDALCREPADPTVVGDRVRRMLTLARDEAADIVAAAHRTAATHKAEAHEHATRLIAEATATANHRLAHARHEVDRLGDILQRTAARLRALDDVLERADALLADEAPDAATQMPPIAA